MGKGEFIVVLVRDLNFVIGICIFVLWWFWVG